jgi:hypothetical protein
MSVLIVFVSQFVSDMFNENLVLKYFHFWRKKKQLCSATSLIPLACLVKLLFSSGKLERLTR